MALKKSLR